ncbi:MAG: hypothetical protein V4498_05705 [candidate division FCPU426 bacterium]
MSLGFKKIPLFASFAYGLKECARHFKSILPLSVFFFLPELAQSLGWLETKQAMGVATEIYKLAIFFFLLMLSVRLTKPKYAPPTPEGVGLSFLAGEILKWVLTLAGLALGAALLYVWYRISDSPALELFKDKPVFEAIKSYSLWIMGRGVVEIACSALVLGILPFYCFMAFNFFGYIIVDTGAGALQAMALSRRLTHRHFWPLAIFYGLCALLQVMGLWAWIVGAVFTFPVTVLATIYIYRDLAKQAEISR